MLDQPTIDAVTRHSTTHDIGYCRCPCYEALMTVSRAIATEDDLRARLAEVSPEALALLSRRRPTEDPDATHD